VALRAVLFDVDGTLLDSELSIRATMNQVLGERGLAPFSKAELAGLIGTPLRITLARRTDDDAAIAIMARRYLDIYMDAGWATSSFFPGVEALVARLRARGLKTGLITSKGQQEAEQLVLDLGARPLFDAIVGDDERRPLKPDPTPILEACATLGRTPSETVMVGDHRVDMLAARAAGCRAVGVLWGHGSADDLRKAGAHELVKTMEELEAAILRAY
jgi:phosphoglycolate phosphatase